MANSPVEVKQTPQAPAGTPDTWRSFRTEMDRLFDRFAGGWGMPSLRRMFEGEPAMRYESVGLIVYKCDNGNATIVPDYPAQDSPVHYKQFFERLYRTYDLRYAYPDSSGKSARKAWTLRGLMLPAVIDSETGFPWSPRLGDDLDQV